MESKLGPLGTSATEWPIVPASGDYDDGGFGGMKIGRGNRSTRRKPYPGPRHVVYHKSHLTRPRLDPGPPRWEASDYPLELLRGPYSYLVTKLVCVSGRDSYEELKNMKYDFLLICFHDLQESDYGIGDD
jgi:hypothetical protein